MNIPKLEFIVNLPVKKHKSLSETYILLERDFYFLSLQNFDFVGERGIVDAA